MQSAGIKIIFNTPCLYIKGEYIISLDFSVSAHLQGHPKCVRLEEYRKPHKRYKHICLKIAIYHSGPSHHIHSFVCLSLDSCEDHKAKTHSKDHVGTFW